MSANCPFARTQSITPITTISHWMPAVAIVEFRTISKKNAFHERSLRIGETIGALQNLRGKIFDHNTFSNCCFDYVCGQLLQLCVRVNRSVG